MAIMEISIVPVGGQSGSFSNAVKQVCRLMEERGFSYQVTPTATAVEGDVDQLLSLATDIHHSSLQNGPERLITHITIDERRDQPMDLQTQVNKVNGETD